MRFNFCVQPVVFRARSRRGGVLLVTALLALGGTTIAAAQIVSPHIKQVWARQVETVWLVFGRTSRNRWVGVL